MSKMLYTEQKLEHLKRVPNYTRKDLKLRERTRFPNQAQCANETSRLIIINE